MSRRIDKWRLMTTSMGAGEGGDMNTNQQTDLFRPGQPDDDAIKLLQSYESFATKIDPRGYCVCTSEGKDSRVLGHLMRRAGVKHFYLHNITGIDPPELVYFQRRNFAEYRAMGYECHDVMFEKSMWQLMMKELMPPLRQKRYCCKHLKERRTEQQGYAMISTGVRKYESVRRAKNRSELEARVRVSGTVNHLNPYDQDETSQVFDTCFNNPSWGKAGLWTINPIAEWPDHWIWDYSKDAKLEQCSLYGEGFHRLGCVGCPMAGEHGRRQEFARWPGFEKLYIRIFEKMFEARVMQGKLVTFDSGRDWFEWWLTDKAQEMPMDEDQLALESFWLGRDWLADPDVEQMEE